MHDSIIMSVNALDCFRILITINLYAGNIHAENIVLEIFMHGILIVMCSHFIF